MTVDYDWPLVANPVTPAAYETDPSDWNVANDPLLNRQQDLLDQARLFDADRRQADDEAFASYEERHRRHLDELGAFNADVARQNALVTTPGRSPANGGGAGGVLLILLAFKALALLAGFAVLIAVGLFSTHTSTTEQPEASDKPLGCSDVGSHPALSVNDEGTLFHWLNPIGSCPDLAGQGFDQ